MKVQDLHGACGFIVFNASFSRLCNCIAELPGVSFTRRSWFVWGSGDERAEFTFHGVSFEIVWDWEGDYWVQPKEKSAWPREISELRSHVANCTPQKGLFELIKSCFVK